MPVDSPTAHAAAPVEPKDSPRSQPAPDYSSPDAMSESLSEATTDTAPPITPLRRAVWTATGIVCLGLATVGVYVPGMPTTVFVIVAAFCFARGNPEKLRWLQEHPTFGPLLARLRPGAFTWQMRAGAIAAITISSTISCLILYPASHLAAWVVAVFAAVGVIAVMLWP